MRSYRRRGAHAARRSDASAGARNVPDRRAVGVGAPRPAGAGRVRQPAAGAGVPRGRGTPGTVLDGFRSRLTLLRVAVAVVVVGFGTLGFVGGSVPSAEPVVRAFLLAWQGGDFRAAAALTTGDPAKVATALSTAYRGLGAAAFYLSMGPISQHGNTAQARFGASVDLGQNGAPWTYQGFFQLHRSGAQWKVVWTAGVVNPHLRPGLHLALTSKTPPRAQILDSAGKSLLTPSTVHVVGVRPASLADPAATARGLGHVTGLDPSQVLGWIEAAPRKSFKELVVFPPAQYARLKKALHQVPGLRYQTVKKQLMTSIAPAVVGSVGTEASSVLRDQGIAYRPHATVGLSGLQRAYQSQLAGAPTTKVVTETAAGQRVEVLKQWTGQNSEPVQTTIDTTVQKAADAAVAKLPDSAAIVAVQPATGHILAVAQHTASGLPAIDPLGGRYAPGTAFTIISTEALLASRLSVNAPVRCPPQIDVGGHNFTNLPPTPRLGAPTHFGTDFAYACATAFTGLSQRLTAGGDLAAGARQLRAAASAFRLGAHWQASALALPGFSGSMDTAGSIAGLAADFIGLSGEKVSPLAMALVAAQVETGVWHSPSLVTSPGDPPRERAVPVDPSILATLRTLMRDVVTSGAGSRANLRGKPVAGQVGTVPPSVAGHGVWAHWFVGYRGGIAFAVMTFSHSKRASAVPVAARFLAAAPAG